MHTGRTPSAQGVGDANHHKTAARTVDGDSWVGGNNFITTDTVPTERSSPIFFLVECGRFASLATLWCGVCGAGERPGKASRDGEMILAENLHTKQLAGKGADKFLPPFCLHRVGSVCFFFLSYLQFVFLLFIAGSLGTFCGTRFVIVLRGSYFQTTTV